MIAVSRRRPIAAGTRAADSRLGHSAEHVFDCGLATAPDSAIRAYATRTEAVIITKDEDFVVREVLASSSRVVWIRTGNTRRAELLRRIESDFPAVVAALERGESVVEIA